jgi:hypothetical protein
MKTARAAVANGLKRAESRADPLGTNSEVGRKLISEAVPDRFQDLLRQLEEREGTPVPASAGVADRE